jgi:hypothetical protein
MATICAMLSSPIPAGTSRTLSREECEFIHQQKCSVRPEPDRPFWFQRSTNGTLSLVDRFAGMDCTWNVYEINKGTQ